MNVVGVIPIKMNNVRTPGKNTRPLCDGTPLIHLIQRTLLDTKHIDSVYVYCSNPDICGFLLPGVQYLSRDQTFDTPEADVIAMMDTFSRVVDADVYVQAHATTPFLRAASVDKAVSSVCSGEFDSALAVRKAQDFFWKDGVPVNYNPESIPRTQDMEPYYIETTGLYVYQKRLIQNCHRRVGFHPCLVEVSETEALDIDTPADFEIVDAVYAYAQRRGGGDTVWI